MCIAKGTNRNKPERKNATFCHPDHANNKLTFLQSSFFFHCSPGRFAILRSSLGEDTFDLLAAAVVPALRELAQLVAAAVLPLPAQQVHQHIVAAAAGWLDTSSLAHDFAVERIECAALEWKEGQEQQRELQASFAAAALLEEQGPQRHAFEAPAGLAGFALLTFYFFFS